MYVGHIAGTMSVFDRRPSARVVNFDNTTNMPVTIDVYSTKNLHEANGITTQLETELEYSLPSAYGMVDLSPNSFSLYADSLKENETIALEFENISKMGSESAVTRCNATCSRRKYCDLNHSSNEEVMYCRSDIIEFDYALTYLTGVMHN